MSVQKRRTAWIARAGLWLVTGLLLIANLLPGRVRGTDDPICMLPFADQEPTSGEAIGSPMASGRQEAPLRPPSPGELPPGTGFIPPRIDLSHLTGQRLPRGYAPTTPPASWDWRTEGKVTAVQDQGACGSCYAFGTIGAFESKLLMDELGTYDLSENNAKECNWEEVNDYGSGTSCAGGNANLLANLFSQKGVVLESCDPYVASDVVCNSSCPYQFTLLDWRIISGSDDVAATEVLKQYIYDYGPVITSFYAGSAFDPAWQDEFGAYDGSYTLYYTGLYNPNHCVLIVGWDDSLSHAGGSGGWIVKNSWGTGWGASGYFTIAYGSARIGTSSSYIHDARAYDTNGDIWYYDEAGWTGSVGYGSTTAWGLVRFTAPSNTSVTGVEFWTTDVTSDVDVYLYDSFDGSTLGSLLALVEDNFWNEAGYHSVPLASPMQVSSSADVVAVVKFTNSSTVYPVPYDHRSTHETNRTYTSGNGIVWYEEGAYGDDIAIRLRTSTVAPTVTSITPDTGENTGVVHITDLAGGDFQSGATVKLAKMGQTDIDASNVVVVDPTQITCDFDLTGAATGAWDVAVTNPDTQSDILSGGFTVYASVSLDLSLGWNLISLPLDPLDPAPEEVLASIAGDYDQVLAYDGCDAGDPWKRYSPGGGENDLTAMDMQHGYWVHTTSAVTLAVTGTLPAAVDIPLCTGWNLAGYPSQSADPVGDALASIAGSYTLVETFDTGDSSDPWKLYGVDLPVYANDLTTMEQERGYWIYATAPCTLSIMP